MAEQATSTDPGAALGEDAELRAELDRSREEILRLRDLLIAKDAELGSAKGQLAQMEAGTARLLGLLARVRSLLPRSAWSALAALSRRGGSQG